MLRAATLACWVVLGSSLSCTAAARAGSGVSAGPDPRGAASSVAAKQDVVFPSDELSLHGVVYRPSGAGPFPAILWNHGAWRDPMIAFDRVAPTFTARGWLFFGPFRRGQGLSSAAGAYIGDEIERAEKSGGASAAAAEAVRLLTSEQLQDQLAAYAWLKAQADVLAQRIAVAGNSFGGIETVLGAARVPYCAAISGAGAAESWAQSPELRDVMIQAARASQSPMFLFQAENDFDLAPSRTLAAVMSAAGKTVELEIYPPYGTTRGEGHNFAWLGSSVWGADVLGFLGRHCND